MLCFFFLPLGLDFVLDAGGGEGSSLPAANTGKEGTANARETAVTIVNRSRERAEPLVALLNEKTRAKATYAPWTPNYRIAEGTDIVVNATSIGLFPDVDAKLDIDLDTLKPGMVVADGIANPPVTNLIREARARGCTGVDGLGMLINQGVIGIKYWTGVDVDPAVMRAKLVELFG